MDGFVFASAIIATWIIAIVYGLGRRSHFIEVATGAPPRWSDFLIYGAICGMLTLLYFSDSHPVIAHTLFIIQGFIVALAPMYFGRLLLRFLAAGRNQKR